MSKIPIYRGGGGSENIDDNDDNANILKREEKVMGRVSERELRVERSMPVQSRIDLVALAELSEYWKGSGFVVTSMSQLVNWSVSAFHELLRKNELLGCNVETLEDAYEVLRVRGLLQKSMVKKMRKKLMVAQGLEGMRLDGFSTNHTEQYKRMHRKGSVEPGPEMASRPDENTSNMLEVYEQLRMDERVGKRKVNDKPHVDVGRNVERMEEVDEKLSGM